MKRNYAALPHSYKRTMEKLSDGEFGRLMRALIDYSESGTPIALTGNERFYAELVMLTEDTAQSEFDDLIESKVQDALSERAQEAAKQRWKGAGMQASKNVCEHMQASLKRKEPKENNHNDIYNNISNKANDTTRVYQAYGNYKWIKLTDEQYSKLVKDLGQSRVDELIEKLDEYVQSNGNKNKYKDFNLVLRKADREHWFERPSNSTSNASAKPKKPMDSRTYSDDDFATGYYSDIMNRPRAGGSN